MPNINQLIEIRVDLAERQVQPHELTDLVVGLMEADDMDVSQAEELENLGLMSQLFWLHSYFMGSIKMLRDSLASYLSQPVEFS